MLRCAALVLSLALAAPALHAQGMRRFPANALRGDIVVTQPPALLLNGQAARLAPGARIQGANRMGLLSAQIIGQRLAVNYTLDTHGNLHDVWILSADERARQPWPGTPQQAAAWSFNADAQTWTKP